MTHHFMEGWGVFGGIHMGPDRLFFLSPFLDHGIILPSMAPGHPFPEQSEELRLEDWTRVENVTLKNGFKDVKNHAHWVFEGRFFNHCPVGAGPSSAQPPLRCLQGAAYRDMAGLSQNVGSTWINAPTFWHLNNCRASHTGDACRGRGRERERGISSELADMTCCELHLRCRRCCWLLLVLLLVLVLVRVVVVVVLVVVLVVVVVVGLVVVVLVVVSVVVVVVVIVVIAVAAWSCGRCRCYLCSWYFFANPSKSSNRRFLQTPKSVK